ncbi:hypothetical protein [Sphaerisporangium sp. NPDC051011]|uniref:hypothetical protein n=1 Tax=Sphaerisporangium sp. NPDC051011 TaxID=3155792 RepID=UPI0033F0F338
MSSTNTKAPDRSSRGLRAVSVSVALGAVRLLPSLRLAQPARPNFRAYVAEKLRQEVAKPEAGDAVPTRDMSADIARLESRIAETRQAAVDGLMPMADAGEILTGLREQINALRAAQAEAAMNEHQRAISADDALALWADDSLDTLGERRAVLGRYVKRIMVHPLGPGRWRMDNIPETSIDIIPAQQKAPAVAGAFCLG